MAGALGPEPLLEKGLSPYKESGVAPVLKGLQLSTLSCNSHSSRLAAVPGVGLGSPRAWRVRTSSWTMPATPSAPSPQGGAGLGSSRGYKRRRRAAWSSEQRKPKRERERCNQGGLPPHPPGSKSSICFKTSRLPILRPSSSAHLEPWLYLQNKLHPLRDPVPCSDFEPRLIGTTWPATSHPTHLNFKTLRQNSNPTHLEPSRAPQF